MEVIGNIGSEPRQINGKNKPFLAFRLAENTSSHPDAKPTWYDVMAFNVPPDIADILSQGQLVKIRGTLSAEVFQDRQGVHKSSLKLLTSSVEFYEFPQRAQRPEQAEQHEGNGQPAARQQEPRQQAQAPRQQAGQPERQQQPARQSQPARGQNHQHSSNGVDGRPGFGLDDQFAPQDQNDRYASMAD